MAPKIKRFREWLLAEMERSQADAARRLAAAGARPPRNKLSEKRWQAPQAAC